MLGLLEHAHRLGLVSALGYFEHDCLASTSQVMFSHSSFAALATALNDRMKQSEIAADNSVSGDHRSPGPPNSAGPADSSAASPGLVSSTRPSLLAVAFVL